MAYLGAIDTSTVEYNTGSREPLPAGTYSLVIVRALQKETKGKNGAGLMVEVEFDITSPDQYTRRKFWDTFNIMNPSTDAQRIALEQLGKLAKAAGIAVLQDDQELLNREVQAEIYIGKEKDTDRLRNRVSGYYPVGVDVKAFKEQLKNKAAGPSTPATGSAVAASPAALPQAGVPSWRKPVA